MPTIINADNGVVSGIAGLKTSADNSGVLALQTNGITAVTVDASQNVTFANSASLPNTFGFKNRIINGDMRIDQRNAGASVSVTDSNQYTLDRWQGVASLASSKFTAQQSSTAATGFAYSLLATSSSAYSVLSTDYFLVRQKIEGFNTSDLNWGTANAATVTLSFWVRSSLTGTFGGAVTNSANSYSYPFSYTISAANTFEQKTITIAGPTAGTWIGATNGIGLQIKFGLGVGSTYSGTAGAWAAADYASVTGATSVVGTNGATWYVTGVQLEKGSTATSFDVRPYATELTLCQRYYWSKALETNYSSIASGAMITTSIARMNVAYPTKMRTSPTITTSNIGNSIISTGLDLNPSGTFTAYANTTSAMMDIDTPATGTVGRGAVWIFGATATTLAASAEL